MRADLQITDVWQRVIEDEIKEQIKNWNEKYSRYGAVWAYKIKEAGGLDPALNMPLARELALRTSTSEYRVTVEIAEGQFKSLGVGFIIHRVKNAEEAHLVQQLRELLVSEIDRAEKTGTVHVNIGTDVLVKRLFGDSGSQSSERNEQSHSARDDSLSCHALGV